MDIKAVLMIVYSYQQFKNIVVVGQNTSGYSTQLGSRPEYWPETHVASIYICHRIIITNLHSDLP